MNLDKQKNLSLKAIQQHHICLVFPIKNNKEPMSLWRALYPKTKMIWEWDETGDQKLFNMWRSREELSRSRDVVYLKWFQNRATFFSRDTFTLCLSLAQAEKKPLSKQSQEILEILKGDSPLSTKQLKEMSGLQGRMLESAYNRAMKELWHQMLIVGFGEIQDSSFPSLAIGATENLFEDLWLKSQKLSAQESLKQLKKQLGPENLFFKYLLKTYQLDPQS